MSIFKSYSQDGGNGLAKPVCWWLELNEQSSVYTSSALDLFIKLLPFFGGHICWLVGSPMGRQTRQFLYYALGKGHSNLNSSEFPDLVKREVSKTSILGKRSRGLGAA